MLLYQWASFHAPEFISIDFHATCVLLRQSDIVECKANHGNGCSLGIVDDLIITLAWECLFPDLTFDTWLLLPFGFVLISHPCFVRLGCLVWSSWVLNCSSRRSVSVLRCSAVTLLIFKLGFRGQGTVGQLLLTTWYGKKHCPRKQPWPARVTLNFFPSAYLLFVFAWPPHLFFRHQYLLGSAVRSKQLILYQAAC